MVSDMELPVSEGLILKPGDKVLLSTKRATISQYEAQRLQDILTQRFPNVEFTIVNGITLTKIED